MRARAPRSTRRDPRRTRARRPDAGGVPDAEAARSAPRNGSRRRTDNVIYTRQQLGRRRVGRARDPPPAAARAPRPETTSAARGEAFAARAATRSGFVLCVFVDAAQTRRRRGTRASAAADGASSPGSARPRGGARAKRACTVSRPRTRGPPWASARPTAASHASRRRRDANIIRIKLRLRAGRGAATDRGGAALMQRPVVDLVEMVALELDGELAAVAPADELLPRRDVLRLVVRPRGVGRAEDVELARRARRTSPAAARSCAPHRTRRTRRSPA